MSAVSRFGLALTLAFLLIAPALAEVSELRITRQPGLIYLPIMIMEHNKLIEKHARTRGLGELKVAWVTFNSGGTATDALLAGNVDLVTSGATNMLLLWGKTNGGVKGVSGDSAAPMWLMTRNPKVKTLADFSAADRIAVPTVKVSTQAMVLQMAAEQKFGESETHKFDAFTVTLGHPDALISLQSEKNEVDSHFSLPPYEQMEAKLPGVHLVLNSVDVTGGPASNAVTFTTTKFHDANPKVIATFLAAMNEATDLILKDKKAAAAIYLEMNPDKLGVDEIAAILSDKNFIHSAAPQQTMKFATFMHKMGYIPIKAASWKDYFFSEVHNLPGS